MFANLPDVGQSYISSFSPTLRFIRGERYPSCFEGLSALSLLTTYEAEHEERVEEVNETSANVGISRDGYSREDTPKKIHEVGSSLKILEYNLKPGGTSFTCNDTTLSFESGDEDNVDEGVKILMRENDAFQSENISTGLDSGLQYIGCEETATSSKTDGFFDYSPSDLTNKFQQHRLKGTTDSSKMSLNLFSETKFDIEDKNQIRPWKRSMINNKMNSSPNSCLHDCKRLYSSREMRGKRRNKGFSRGMTTPRNSSSKMHVVVRAHGERRDRKIHASSNSRRKRLWSSNYKENFDQPPRSVVSESSINFPHNAVPPMPQRQKKHAREKERPVQICPHGADSAARENKLIEALQHQSEYVIGHDKLLEVSYQRREGRLENLTEENELIDIVEQPSLASIGIVSDEVTSEEVLDQHCESQPVNGIEEQNSLEEFQQQDAQRERVLVRKEPIDVWIPCGQDQGNSSDEMIQVNTSNENACSKLEGVNQKRSLGMKKLNSFNVKRKKNSDGEDLPPKLQKNTLNLIRDKYVTAQDARKCLSRETCHRLLHKANTFSFRQKVAHAESHAANDATESLLKKAKKIPLQRIVKNGPSASTVFDTSFPPATSSRRTKLKSTQKYTSESKNNSHETSMEAYASLETNSEVDDAAANTMLANIARVENPSIKQGCRMSAGRQVEYSNARLDKGDKLECSGVSKRSKDFRKKVQGREAEEIQERTCRNGSFKSRRWSAQKVLRIPPGRTTGVSREVTGTLGQCTKCEVDKKYTHTKNKRGKGKELELQNTCKRLAKKIKNPLRPLAKLRDAENKWLCKQAASLKEMESVHHEDTQIQSEQLFVIEGGRVTKSAGKTLIESTSIETQVEKYHSEVLETIPECFSCLEQEALCLKPVSGDKHTIDSKKRERRPGMQNRVDRHKEPRGSSALGNLCEPSSNSSPLQGLVAKETQSCTPRNTTRQSLSQSSLVASDIERKSVTRSRETKETQRRGFHNQTNVKPSKSRSASCIARESHKSSPEKAVKCNNTKALRLRINYSSANEKAESARRASPEKLHAPRMSLSPGQGVAVTHKDFQQKWRRRGSSIRRSQETLLDEMRREEKSKEKRTPLQEEGGEKKRDAEFVFGRKTALRKCLADNGKTKEERETNKIRRRKAWK